MPNNVPSSGRRIRVSPKKKKKRNYGPFLLGLLVMALVLVLLLFITRSCRNHEDTPARTTEPSETTLPETTDVPSTTEPAETSLVTEPETTSPATTLPDPPVNPEKVIRLAAVGDVLIHECVYLDAQTSDGYDFLPMFSGLSSLIENADLAFANMECPIAGNRFGVRGYPNFNAPTQAGDALVQMGFNVINMANNHMLDMEKITTGYKNSVDYWKAQDVLMIGGYSDSEDYQTIRTVSVEDVTFAFLSFTYSFNKKVNSDSSEMVVPFFDDQTVKNQIQAARACADVVIVSAHWGKENVHTPTSEMKRLAQLMADAGADVILGTHSHTIQPIEWISGRSGQKTLCVYSLGNCISSQLYMNQVLEDLVTMDIRVSPEGTISLENIIAHPVICHYETNPDVKDSQDFHRRENIRLYLLEDYTEDLCRVHGAHRAYPDYKESTESFTISTLKDLFRSVISDEFLPEFMK